MLFLHIFTESVNDDISFLNDPIVSITAVDEQSPCVTVVNNDFINSNDTPKNLGSSSNLNSRKPVKPHNTAAFIADTDRKSVSHISSNPSSLAIEAECDSNPIVSVKNDSSSIKECCFLGSSVVHSHCYGFEELDIGQQIIQNFNPILDDQEECPIVSNLTDCSMPSPKRVRSSQKNPVRQPGA